MERWIGDHTEDVAIANRERAGLRGKKLLQWYKDHPVSPANLVQLRLSKMHRELTKAVERERGKTLPEKFDRLKGLVAAGYKFALTNKGTQPEEIAANDILQILGLEQKCTVREVEEALIQLRAAGELTRIVEEVRAHVR
jgi:hypothetical protein